MEGNKRYKIAYVQGGGIEALFFFFVYGPKKSRTRRWRVKFANSNKLWLQSFDTLNSSLAKKKSCATKTFLLWFTLYLAVSKALGG